MIRWARTDGRDGVPGHEAARALGLRLLAETLLRDKGICLEDGALAHTPAGKPFLPGHPDVHVSLSHCEGLAACVVADVPAGIDAERLRPFNPHAARHAMSDKELRAIETAAAPDLAFFQRWTLKESYLKAMGTGLGYPLRELEFAVEGSEAACASRPEYRFRVWQVAGEYVLAVCVMHEEMRAGTAYSWAGTKPRPYFGEVREWPISLSSPASESYTAWARSKSRRWPAWTSQSSAASSSSSAAPAAPAKAPY